MSGVSAQLREVREALAASRSLPLSVRHARVVAALLDVMPDRVYGERHTEPEALFGAADRAAYREAVLARSDAMVQIASLFGDPPTARLTVTDCPVAADAAPSLEVGDFMVSVYNDHTVPRLMLVRRDGPPVLADAVFEAAVAFWEGVDP